MSASLAPECNEVKEYVWRKTEMAIGNTIQTLRHLLPEVVQRE